MMITITAARTITVAIIAIIKPVFELSELSLEVVILFVVVDTTSAFLEVVVLVETVVLSVEAVVEEVVSVALVVVASTVVVVTGATSPLLLPARKSGM